MTPKLSGSRVPDDAHLEVVCHPDANT